MALKQAHHLSPEQIQDLFSLIQGEELLEVISIRYKNKDEIRKSSFRPAAKLRAFILQCIEEEDQPGGDIEVIFPNDNTRLVGHHDGVYWIEKNDA